MNKTVFLKRIILSAVASVVLASSLFAQDLKSVVGVVRQQFTPETLTFFENSVKGFNDAGFDTYASSIEGFRDNCSGTGFVWVAKDGKNYVVTNRHVVPSKENASIEFENEDGSFKKYENLKVIAFDENADVALLSFPEGEKPFKSGLKFADKKALDGEDVWSAGFPGLGKDVLWQFGKGTVTNASARIKDLLDPEVSALIQHSAQVDSGNSGGPLLRKVSNDSYEVIGINTWKATYRDSTNYSIPSAVIVSFIEKTLSENVAKDKAIKAVLNDFLSDLNNEETKLSDLSDYVSYKAVSEDGVSYVVDAYRKGSVEARESVNSDFSSNPVKGMKTAAAFFMRKEFKAGDFSKDCSFEEPVENDDGSVTVKFKADSKAYNTVWVSEAVEKGYMQTTWKIQSWKDAADKSKKSSSSKKGKSVSTGMDMENVYTAAVYGVYMPALTQNYNLFGLGLDFNASDLFGCKFEIGFDSHTGEMGKKLVPIVCGFDLHVPLKYNSFYFVPFAELGMGATFGDFSDGMGAGYYLGGGLKGGMTFDTVSIFAYAEYRRVSAGLFITDSDKKGKNAVAVGLGVAF